MGNKVTIIMPVYNGEKYLKNAIESIVAQKYNEWLLLIINDGSTDKTSEIIREFTEKDKRIIEVYQENMGLAGALNKGLTLINTPYFTFIDADDSISDDTLSENMPILIQNIKIDFLQYPIFEKYGSKKQRIIKKHEEVLSENFYTNWLEKKKISWITNDKIYKTEAIGLLKFTEGIVYEDNLFISQLLNQVNKVFISEKGLYYYYDRENSITTSPLNLKKEKDSFYVTFQIFKELKKKKMYDKAADFLVRLINIRKSLKVNFNYEAEWLKKKDSDFLKWTSIFQLNLPQKDKIKLLLFKLKG